MKLGRLISKTSSFPAQSPFHNVSGLTWYSTQTLKLKEREPQGKTLCRRIWDAGKPSESIVPILDQWVLDDRPVTQIELRNIIRDFRRHRRFKHALEVSQWMSDKRYMHLRIADVAIRLNLLVKVHGIEEAENYFYNTAKQMKTVEVYGALLSCYAEAKCIDKADAVMRKMKELGFAQSTINYNLLLNLYRQTGNHEKINALILEMEAKQIKFDDYTYCILLNAFGAHSDIDGIEKILKRIESDAEFNIDWSTYADAANQFLRAKNIDKALEALTNAEKLVPFGKKKNEVLAHLLTLYGKAGKKEEVLRIWNECKKSKLHNRNYFAMMSSILKLDDIETAEKIFEEWKGIDDISKDIRIPNFLIQFYCKNGLIEKAEALIETVKKENWQEPNATTWYLMTLGYIECNQMVKAVEALKSAILQHIPGSRWRLEKESMMACLQCLKEGGDMDRSSDLVSLLKEKGIISGETRYRLLAYLSGLKIKC